MIVHVAMQIACLCSRTWRVRNTGMNEVTCWRWPGLTEVAPDVSEVKPGGLDQIIIPDASRVWGKGGGKAVGSCLHKIGGKYYVFPDHMAESKP